MSFATEEAVSDVGGGADDPPLVVVVASVEQALNSAQHKTGTCSVRMPRLSCKESAEYFTAAA